MSAPSIGDLRLAVVAALEGLELVGGFEGWKEARASFDQQLADADDLQARSWAVGLPDTVVTDPRRRVRTRRGTEEGMLCRTTIRVRLVTRIRPEGQRADLQAALEAERRVLQAVGAVDLAGIGILAPSAIRRTAAGVWHLSEATYIVDHLYALADPAVDYPSPLPPVLAPGPPPSTATPTAAGDWYVLRLADAVEVLAESGTADVVAQDGGGWVSTRIDALTFATRFEPYDSNEVRQYRWALLDALGDLVDPADDATVELYLEPHPTEPPPPAGDGVVVWIGVADRAGVPSGAGKHRIAGLHYLSPPVLRLAAPATGISQTLGAVGPVHLVAQTWASQVTAAVLDPNTLEPTGERVEDEVAWGASAYPWLGVGTSATTNGGAADPTAPVTFRPWARVTRRRGPGA